MWPLIACHSPLLKQSLIYLMHDHGILSDIFGSWLLRAKTKPVNSNYFWQIYLQISEKSLLGKMKIPLSLRLISLFFPSEKSSSKRTCAYWQWIYCVSLCCKVFEIVKVGSSTFLAKLLSGMPFTLYESFAWQTFASLGLFTWLVYVRTYCVPMATLNQNRRSRKPYLGDA